MLLVQLLLYNLDESKHVYVGKTKRHFLTRIKEHETTQTAVRLHCDTCPCFSHENFSVLRTCKSDYEATIVEALYINELKPSLNGTIVNSGASTFLKL